MKKLVLTLLVAATLPTAVHAQAVGYSYDAAGNRVSRALSAGALQSPRINNTRNMLADRQGQTLSVGPNPTTGMLSVSLARFADADECRLLLSNMAGQTLIEQSMTSTQATLDLTSYPSGYYLLLVDVNGEKTSYKIIKN